MLLSLCLVACIDASPTAGLPQAPRSASRISTTPATILTGEAPNSYFGLAVSGAGDVNADGYDDVIVGAYYFDTGAGRAYIYMGSAEGLSDTPINTLSGEENDRFGWSVAAAGDVDGDGFDDVIVGVDSGRYAAVFRGSAAGIADSPAWVLRDSESSNGSFGYSVAGAGDVNADGFADVIVGSPHDDGVRGQVIVYEGSSEGPIATTLLAGTEPYEYLGESVAGAGDVNADGYDDVIAGAWGRDDYAGGATIYAGSATGIGDVPLATLSRAGPAGYFGLAVSGAGDMNADGYDDIVVGSNGAAQVFPSSALGPSSAVTTTLSGAGVGFGWAVGGVGDVDGDGYADVLIGSPEYGVAGTAALFTGSASGMTSTADLELTEATSTELGCSVARAGDVNGDGFADMVVGARGYDSFTGRALVFLGSPVVDADGDGSPEEEDCDDEDPASYPGGEERCDAAQTDEDCDGLVDDADPSARGQAAHYADADADGYGDAGQEIWLCHPPDDLAAAAGDCDDAAAAVNPGAQELCNGIDDDCDGIIDGPNSADAATWGRDDDGDGFTAAVGVLTDCEAPEGYGPITAEVDCDDTDPNTFPGGDDIPGDRINQDCVGDPARYTTTGASDKLACGCQTESPAAGWALAAWAAGIGASLRRARLGV